MSTRARVEEAAEARLLAVDEASLRLIDLALAEDIGPGDWTTRWTVPPRARIEGALVAGAPGIVAGVPIAAAVFRRLSPRVDVTPLRVDGDVVAAGAAVARIRGPARSILAGRRTALDFLRRLSGIATLARAYVDALEGTGAIVLGCGQGTPGWRLLDAAALRAGGAQPHRLGLYDAVVIGAAHAAAAGSVAEAVRAVRDQDGRGLRVHVEAGTPAEVAEAAAAGADVAILVGGDPEAVREAAELLRACGNAPTQLAAAADVEPDGARRLALAGAGAVLVAGLPAGAAPLAVAFQVARR